MCDKKKIWPIEFTTLKDWKKTLKNLSKDIKSSDGNYHKKAYRKLNYVKSICSDTFVIGLECYGQISFGCKIL